MIDATTFHYLRYIAEFGKNHIDIADFNARLVNFAANHNFIEQHNASGANWIAGHNQFSDMHHVEYKAMLGYVRGEQDVRNAVMLDTSANADSVNWVEAGAVTAVKDQGQCGSCWTFSTTGSLEGAHFLATGELLSFSESQLVDCAGLRYGNMGCNGGLQDNAYKYYEAGYDAMLESAYPYVAKKGSCQYDATNATNVTVSAYTHVAVDDYQQMKAAMNIAPLAVAIEADQRVFQTYKSGVLDSDKCGTTLDHAVLAVGYGTDSASGLDYWLVKNSWNTTWGDNGYIKLAMNSGAGICGVQSDAEWPTSN